MEWIEVVEEGVGEKWSGGSSRGGERGLIEKVEEGGGGRDGIL